MYARELSKKYSGVTLDTSSESSPLEQIYSTSEGPVLIVREGTQVFISETFDMTLARKLQFLFFGAQEGGQTEQAARALPPDLTANLTRIMAGCGLMKASLHH